MTELRYRLRPDAGHAVHYSTCVLCDDGRIIFEPRGRLRPIFSVQGIKPPLRRTALSAEVMAHPVRDIAQLVGFMLGVALMLIAMTQWLAWHP